MVGDGVNDAPAAEPRPEIAALSMSGSSIIVAVNALALKRLPLPVPADGSARHYRRAVRTAGPAVDE